MFLVEVPKAEKKILPNLTPEQVERLINNAECIRDKAIISLFSDSGLRLRELANIETCNIDWQNRLIKVKCKSNKEGFVPFGKRTETLLRQWLGEYKANDPLWDIKSWSIVELLAKLKTKTGFSCNPHTFRRTFTSILAKKGIDSLHIIRLGRWESI